MLYGMEYWASTKQLISYVNVAEMSMLGWILSKTSKHKIENQTSKHKIRNLIVGVAPIENKLIDTY